MIEHSIAPRLRNRPNADAVNFGSTLVSLDLTVINVAQPQHDIDLGAGVSRLQRIVDG